MTKKVLMKLNRVTRTYVMGEVTVEALKETSLELYEGELMVILGPSGSGKSTLLNIMGGMDLASGGQVYFGQEDLTRAGDKQLTRYRRYELGFVFQFYNLIPDLTARENVELSANLVANPLPVEEVLRDVGLGSRSDHFPSQLSGGEQQRVAIARAAVKNPRLLLCDEPTGALDHQTGRLILALLAKINRERGSTVVIVTHNTPISAMAHRVVRMSSGAVVDISENRFPLPPERIEW
ncbi:ABC transporter related [Desulfofarcimen acetoxidans DSM 771]|jgi:putative ABC transport system ATP-binding protein|uniref:ABC transporter related n=1 Tax=Desulfofarcimen acetoxidans (strain ATCC 49208 / DSM 771 / KCTC 5769 / VKM B-1644 / 5575) TaxID=485916 RepID=C8W2F5_DESAS|nr:ABC transporter ATP-binding protein [Desulfofarcimen acetoxidans]ACV63639.1 ABC transporter related [Desulfofarcimen acetoxidans DSM 771]